MRDFAERWRDPDPDGRAMGPKRGQGRQKRAHHLVGLMEREELPEIFF